MQKNLELLINLNTDPVHVEDLAKWVYGNSLGKAVYNTQTVIHTLRENGWDIYHCHKRGYVLSAEHYAIIEKAFIGPKCYKWEHNARLSPRNVQILVT